MSASLPGLRRGKGHLPDDVTTVALELGMKHVCGLFPESVFSAPSPGVVDYSYLLKEVPDQGATSSCVGQAFATALFLRAAVAGTPIPRPAAKLIYDFARFRDDAYKKLADAGSRPLAAIACLREKGMVADSDWPIVFSPDGSTNIDVPPPLDVYQKALGYRVDDYYRIAPGPGASTMIRTALSQRHFPVFAMPVDAAYEEWASGIYPGRRSSSLGGHMQATCGSGDGFVKVAGSWSPSFAEGGFVRIANDYFDSGECTDIIVVTMVPTDAAA